MLFRSYALFCFCIVMRKDTVCYDLATCTPTSALLCSDRRRLTILRKQLEPSLTLHTAASGDAMLPHLAHTQHPAIAAVDITFLHQHGLQCLSWCDRTPHILGTVIFGLDYRHAPPTPSLYRFNIRKVVYGYEPLDILHTVKLVWEEIRHAA